MGVTDGLYFSGRNKADAVEDKKERQEGVLYQSGEGFRSPEPALVFLVFLPALIFESAFNSDWYTFKR